MRLLRLVKPPLVLLLLLLAAWWFGNRFPEELSFPARQGAGWFVVLTATIVMTYCAWLFYRYRTTIWPTGTPTALLESGPFRYSRNPIYVCMASILAGTGIMLGNLAMLAAMPLFVLWIWWVFICYEEQQMHISFSTAYSDYCARVRRWV